MWELWVDPAGLWLAYDGIYHLPEGIALRVVPGGLCRVVAGVVTPTWKEVTQAQVGYLFPLSNPCLLCETQT